MSRQQEGRPPPSDRELMPPPPRPRPPALFRTLGTTTTPIILSDTESESDSDDDDGSASSTPHASAGPPRDAMQLMLDDLRSVLQGGRTGNFCIGGRIPISPIGNFPTSSQEGGRRVSSVTLRFDTPDGSVSRIQLPLRSDGLGFDQLLRACTPSSFGGPEVGELDASHFSTDFHPHDCGIIDTIAQTLLPGVEKPITEGMKGREEQWGVRAELKSLNIYSPSSTPLTIQHPSNNATHFGTLLLILPFPHQGGALSLTHKSHTQAFTPNTPSLHYLAFHNPSTLTLSPLTAGHLLTLTYTLHLVPPSSLPSPLIDAPLSPVFTTLRTLLQNPTFLPQGGTLGFYCSHPYAHTLRNASSLLPHSLKGIDASLFSALNALGLKTTVRPVLGDEAWDEYEEWRMSRWMASEEEVEEGEVLGTANVSRVGRGFGRIKMVDLPILPGEDPSGKVNKFFPFKAVEDVLWLNEARHEGWEVQMVNLRAPAASGGNGRGNGKEAAGGLMWHYSCVAILCGIPGWRDRRGLGSLAEEEEEVMGD